MNDSVFMILLIALTLINKTKQMFITTVAFFATVVFSHSYAFDLMPPFYIHLSYALILIPFINISNYRASIGLGIYAIFQCFIAIDYLFYPNTDTFIAIYYNILHNVIDFGLIYLSIERGHNVGRDNYAYTHNLHNHKLNTRS